ncbi:hypothetical protein CAPTEDRAFT_128475 [Capitella teleta]|uniref:Leucine-rich repeat flightless-interacting protein 2 n=1 Tax=Capitella teleta TaxID=283909 RepID=R7TBT5_CAPTE|nr:hypothetical protein CAPTEDRAFT_128475 [Capitella teleta]|eukprot:ELT91174.1 hypothetical protein CAPTEDRAFT_128475 [Capitella teleta]
MSSPSSSGRKRTTSRQYSAEDQALNQIAREAENRIAARRAARAEARDVRVREIERQQKEQEEKEGNDPASDYKQPGSSSRFTATALTSRRGSNESSSTGDDTSNRELRREINDLEEKYRKSMLNNAQLDSEKQTFRYQVDLYRDQCEDLKEEVVEVTRLHKDKSRDLEHKKRDCKELERENQFLKEQMKYRDELIEQYGLVFISNENLDEKGEHTNNNKKEKNSGTIGLVTPDAAQILQKHEGNLDNRLKKFAEEQTRLEAENNKLKQQLEEEKEKSSLAEEKYATSPRTPHKENGPDVHALEMQMEAQKQLNDYKFRLKKAEQEITTFEGNVIRLESQVKRYRSAAENSEKVEDELKSEKRKLQRELREAQAQIEELNSQNHHLQKRIEKIKSSRNTYK